MKAIFIAAGLSLSLINITAHAVSVPSTPSVKQSQAQNNQIDLNKADLSTLTGSFKGIGKKRAEAIIAYRENHKGFKAIDELAEVKGFGSHFLEANREKLKEKFVIN